MFTGRSAAPPRSTPPEAEPWSARSSPPQRPRSRLPGTPPSRRSTAGRWPSMLRSLWSTPSSTFLPRKAHELSMEKNMKIMKAMGALGLAGFFAGLGSHAALAQDAGWYGGIGIGQSRAKINDDRIRAGLPGVTSIQDDDTDTGFKLFAGRQFTRN